MEQNTKVTTEVHNDDPRYGFAVVSEAMKGLIDGSLGSLDAPTPCADFSVKELLEHVVMVQRRVAVVGNGEPWSTVQQASMSTGWGDAFAEATHDVQKAWEDESKFERIFEVPWGSFPGAPILLSYTAEQAVHGWDLATATGQNYSIDDDVLAGALFAAKVIPAEGRDSDFLPFDAVVDPGPDASAILQMAGWMGRKVI